jgi:hypothetical protein
MRMCEGKCLGLIGVVYYVERNYHYRLLLINENAHLWQ